MNACLILSRIFWRGFSGESTQLMLTSPPVATPAPYDEKFILHARAPSRNPRGKPALRPRYTLPVAGIAQQYIFHYARTTGLK